MGKIGVDARGAIRSRRADGGGVPVVDVDQLPCPGEVDRRVGALVVLLVDADREGRGVTRRHVGVRRTEAWAPRVNQVTGRAAAVEDDRHAVDWTRGGAGRAWWRRAEGAIGRSRIDGRGISMIPDVQNGLPGDTRHGQSVRLAVGRFVERDAIANALATPRPVENCVGLPREANREAVGRRADSTGRRNGRGRPGQGCRSRGKDAQTGKTERTNQSQNALWR